MSGGTAALVGALTGNNFNLRINGAAGQTYRTYTSSNLTTSQPGPTVTLTGATYNYVDANVTGNNTFRFYKAILQ